MARIVKEYDERYTEFLNTAQALFFSKGYAATSVAEIIKTVGVAKGTFYHYFASKSDILEAIVDRITQQLFSTLQPILDDPVLNAVQKLERFVGTTSQWKAARKPEMLETARALYQDDNVLLREKMQRYAVKATVPLLARIIAQGSAEGVFDVQYHTEAAEIVVAIMRVMTENATMFILSENRDADDLDHLKRQVVLCNQSVARVLGMTPGTLNLFEIEFLDTWLTDQ
jgi:AcrR family transcriptional regulator